MLILQMPRFGRQFKVYDRILPSQILDVTDVIEDGEFHDREKLLETEAKKPDLVQKWLLVQVRFSQKRTEMRAQIDTKKFEELTGCWGSFLTSTGSSRLVRTLWMS